jgi:hypothetical protein
MRLHKRWIALAVAPATVVLTAGLASAAVAARSTAPSGAQRTYVVILRDQNAALGARSAARHDAVRSQQAPVLSQLSSLGGTEIASTSLVNAVIVKTTAAGARALAGNPAVSRVVPNQLIPGPTLPQFSTTPGDASPGSTAASSAPVCSTDGSGTSADPQLNPEALDAINATSPGADGAGVTVALIADGLDTTNPDFQRNAAFASAGSAAGSPVVKEVDFSTDGINAPTPGGEAFLDASSIAAQANTTYNLNDVLASDHQITGGCYIKVQGVAPGANVLALKTFATTNETTTSAFLQAINYAVSAGAKVLNESFGSNDFPSLAADVYQQADNAAVKAGVTVVAASGDAGSNNTVSSPASDPNVISVGASTTYRGYEQSSFGGINVPGVGNGSYVDNNISDISSGGFSQTGSTVDLVAPGDQNWALCTANTTLYTDCTNVADTGAADLEFTGGTSEAAPLTAGAAADVIQAYAETHAGKDPSPALVKQILMSSATDIDAPATQQGAGLLNVAAAVKLAESIGNSSSTGALLVSPGQINVAQKPHGTTTKTISVTNTSSSSVSVSLSTRALTKEVGSDSGTFCLQPETGTSTTPPASCPANTGTMPIWSGVTEVYQTKTFTVPATSGASRLDFMADYPYTGQSSLLHVALFEPDGAYAMYSFPQGLADYADLQVANPPKGTWTAVFFTEQDGATTDGTGTTGRVQWRATTWQYASGSKISAKTLTVKAGQTASAKLTVVSPAAPGDTSESVVVSSGATKTSIPVTIRTVVPTTAKGGSFTGVVTGGNGRGIVAQASYYEFHVPKGAKNIHVDVKLATDPDDAVTAYLIDPTGQNLGYSTNVTLNGSLNIEIVTKAVDVYHARPVTGTWTLALQVDNAVSGSELSQPFKGTIGFGALPVTGSLPSGSKLTSGKTYTFKIKVRNSGSAPEAYFADPRLSSDEKITLPNANSSVTASDLTLPAPAPTTSTVFPYYFVPTQTTELHETVTGSAPVDFDSEYFPGDPDLEGVRTGDSASLTYSNAAISPGLWTLVPDEVGPFPSTGAPTVTAAATAAVITQAFDKAVRTSTGDFWSLINGLSAGDFAPVYVEPGKSATITVKIKVSGAVGSVHRGTLFIDDVTLVGLAAVFDYPNTDEVAALPYSYKVAK